MLFKRKAKKPDADQSAERQAQPEPDISQPINAFLEASDRWATDNRNDQDSGEDFDRVIFSAIDPKTGMIVEVAKVFGIFSQFPSMARCTNHNWVTDDEAKAVWDEIMRVREERVRARRKSEREMWCKAYGLEE